jgi:stage II sporulation protein AB (anti-sigma F factor)
LTGLPKWINEEFKMKDEIKIILPSRSANEGFARMAVSAFATRFDPTLEEMSDIKTAVSEAVTNCIVHAYPDELGMVKLRLRLLEDSIIEITVKDKGVGIPDVARAREPLYTTGNEERSGMGFTIMESFTDEMKVRSQVGKGTTVVLRKRIARRRGQVR